MTLPDLSMIRGDTATFPLTLYGDDSEPLNLDNLDLTFSVKHYLSDSEAFITKTLDDGIEIVDAEDGTITVTLEPADTEDISFWTYLGWNRPMIYVWDVQAVDADYADAVRTRRRGVLRIYRGVTVAAV